MSFLRNIAAWFRGRDVRWVARRSTTLVRHYGVTSGRAKRRVLACVELLERFGTVPMFAVPGRVLDQEAAFFRSLAERGVELAPHGYDHVDFRTLTGEQARAQFERACHAFRRGGVPFTGFRCPYLGYTDELLPVVPPEIAYASHLAIRWDVPFLEAAAKGAVAAQLASFYRAVPAAEYVSRPRMANGLVEIPASLPDDFELTMGARADADAVARVWSEVWKQVDERGELFAPLFHPEAYDHCALAFEEILGASSRPGADVWLAPLGEIAGWWLDRSGSHAVVEERGNGLRLDFRCPARSTVLVRSGPPGSQLRPWHHGYDRLEGTTLDLEGRIRPFVGLSASFPAVAAAWLREEGFVVVENADPELCAVYLDEGSPGELGNEVELVRHVEAAGGTLVRFGRWPDGARSAVSVAGDLDALRLTDYLGRFRAR